MIDEEWTVLPQEEAEKFIKAVRSLEFSPLFTAKSYELWSYPLPFTEGYYRYSLNNTTFVPYFSMDYISNGENHFYLDGSEHPIALLARVGALKLTNENVLSYLDFFDDVVFDPVRKVKFIINAQDTGYSGASAMEHHFKAIGYAASIQVEDLGDYFKIHIPILYNSETVKGIVRVDKTGEIRIESPVSIHLMEREYNRTEPLRYHHPFETEVLINNREILGKSALGSILLNFCDNYQVKLKVLSGITRKSFWTDGLNAYITVPQDVRFASPYQVLELAGVLRGAEVLNLDLEEETGPDKPTDDDLDHARNLDILVTLCKIGDELKDAGYPEALEKLKLSGAERLYSAYKNEVSYEELTVIYEQITGTNNVTEHGTQ